MKDILMEFIKGKIELVNKYLDNTDEYDDYSNYMYYKGKKKAFEEVKQKLIDLDKK